jgi:hypothetical protein
MTAQEQCGDTKALLDEIIVSDALCVDMRIVNINLDLARAQAEDSKVKEIKNSSTKAQRGE